MRQGRQTTGQFGSHAESWPLLSALLELPSNHPDQPNKISAASRLRGLRAYNRQSRSRAAQQLQIHPAHNAPGDEPASRCGTASGRDARADLFADLLDEGLGAVAVAAFVVDDLTDEPGFRVAGADRAVANFDGELLALERNRPRLLFDDRYLVGLTVVRSLVLVTSRMPVGSFDLCPEPWQAGQVVVSPNELPMRPSPPQIPQLSPAMRYRALRLIVHAYSIAVFRPAAGSFHTPRAKTAAPERILSAGAHRSAHARAFRGRGRRR